MHTHYIFGLLLIFLLSMSYSMPTTEDNYWKQFDDDDEYDDYSTEENISKAINSNKSNTTIEITTVKTTNFKSDLDNKLKEKNLVISKCPDNCDCDEELLSVNCSNRNFETIPKMLPISLTELDLSNNYIKEISKDELDKFINMQKILLNNNEIKNLDKDVFNGNKKLRTVNLASNKLTAIDQNIFIQISSISDLDLSNNAIKLPNVGSFLNAPELKVLTLRNCSINEIFDDTFKNTSGLAKLMLDKNDFNKKINTQAFNVSLQNLMKLTLPELEQTDIYELCQILQSIDIISFGNSNLSCFQIVAELPPLNGTQIDESNKNTNNQNPINSRDSNTPTKLLGNRKSKKNMTTTANTLNITTEQNNYDKENVGEKDESAVQISSEIINYCLFAIMGIAVIGLIIGVICRKDIYGIKTKLCRTKKTRGPVKTDNVKPAEEIPLNKV